LLFSTRKDVKRYEAEKKFGAAYMGAVKAAATAHGFAVETLLCIETGRDGNRGICFKAEISKEIRTAHEGLLAKSAIDSNLFEQDDLSELSREAAWLMGGLCTETLRFDFSDGKFVARLRDGTLQVCGDKGFNARWRVLAGWVEAKGIDVKLKDFIGYIKS
jgi:hypothetical protein